MSVPTERNTNASAPFFAASDAPVTRAVRRGSGLRAVFLGRVEPRKGLHHALDAEVRDRNFGAVLVLWDYLFGTHVPPKHENYALGVADDVPVARGLIGV